MVSRVASWSVGDWKRYLEGSIKCPWWGVSDGEIGPFVAICDARIGNSHRRSVLD